VLEWIAAHARRHRRLLDEGWRESDLSRKQAEQIMRRIDGVLHLLPMAQKQAHERKLICEQAPADSKLLVESIQRVERAVEKKIKSSAADRGFESSNNVQWLNGQGIYNAILGKPMRAKGFGHREKQIAWGVLTHNLWVIARLPVAVEEKALQKAA